MSKNTTQISDGVTVACVSMEMHTTVGTRRYDGTVRDDWILYDTIRGCSRLFSVYETSSASRELFGARLIFLDLVPLERDVIRSLDVAKNGVAASSWPSRGGGGKGRGKEEEEGRRRKEGGGKERERGQSSAVSLTQCCS